MLCGYFYFYLFITGDPSDLFIFVCLLVNKLVACLLILMWQHLKLNREGFFFWSVSLKLLITEDRTKYITGL